MKYLMFCCSSSCQCVSRGCHSQHGIWIPSEQAAVHCQLQEYWCCPIKTGIWAMLYSLHLTEKLHMQIIQYNTKITSLPQQRKEVNSLWTTWFCERLSAFSNERIKRFVSQSIHTFWTWLLLQYCFLQKKSCHKRKIFTMYILFW